MQPPCCVTTTPRGGTECNKKTIFCFGEIICPLLRGTSEGAPSPEKRGGILRGQAPLTPDPDNIFHTISGHLRAPRCEPWRGGEHPGSHRNSRGNLFFLLFPEQIFFKNQIRAQGKCCFLSMIEPLFSIPAPLGGSWPITTGLSASLKV